MDEAVRDADHPREYGENAADERERELLEGPSPRIRGEFVRSWLPLT